MQKAANSHFCSTAFYSVYHACPFSLHPPADTFQLTHRAVQPTHDHQLGRVGYLYSLICSFWQGLVPGWAVGGLCEYTTGVECSSLVQRLRGSRVDHPCTERSNVRCILYSVLYLRSTPDKGLDYRVLMSLVIGREL